MNLTRSILRFSSALCALSIAPSANAQAHAPASLYGIWDAQQTAAKGDGSNPVWHAPKVPHFLMYAFRADGTWTRTIDRADGKPLQAHGTFSIEGNNILLKNDDGSKPLSWKFEFKNGDQEMDIDGGGLLMKLVKVPAASP
jgi:hypothetical protein